MIKKMRDKQKKPKCQICNDEEWVEHASGTLGRYVECECKDMGIIKCVNCYTVLTGEEKNITSQLCNECYENEVEIE